MGGRHTCPNEQLINPPPLTTRRGGASVYALQHTPAPGWRLVRTTPRTLEIAAADEKIPPDYVERILITTKLQEATIHSLNRREAHPFIESVDVIRLIVEYVGVCELPRVLILEDPSRKLVWVVLDTEKAVVMAGPEQLVTLFKKKPLDPTKAFKDQDFRVDSSTCFERLSLT